jgi:hypothetical protein
MLFSSAYHGIHRSLSSSHAHQSEIIPRTETAEVMSWACAKGRHYARTKADCPCVVIRMRASEVVALPVPEGLMRTVCGQIRCKKMG